MQLQSDRLTETAVDCWTRITVDARSQIYKTQRIVDEWQTVNDCLDHFLLDRFEIVLCILSGPCVPQNIERLTLSQATKRANKLPMIRSFSIAGWSAKLVKIDPVVGLYTWYIS